MKVSGKIILVSSLVLIIAVSSLSFFQYNKMKTTLRQQSSSAIAESSDALALQITNWLNGKLENIDYTAQVIDADFSDENIQRTINTPLLKDNFLLMFGGLSTDGKAISNDPTWNPTDWDARKRPWYGVAKSANQAQITEPYEDAVTHEMIISVVANLTDNGKFKGAFGGDLSLKTVSDSLNTLTFNNAGYAFLLSKNGNVISHPDGKLNGKNYKKLFLGKSLPLNITSAQEIEVNGENLWVSFTPLKDLRGMEWYIGVVINADIIMADANKLGVHSMIGGLISVIISMLLLTGVLKIILQPITNLSESLLEINSGNGDLTKRLIITSNDEFAVVATQFNIFVDNLQGIISNVKNLANDVDQSNEKVSIESEKASTELGASTYGVRATCDSDDSNGFKCC